MFSSVLGPGPEFIHSRAFWIPISRASYQLNIDVLSHFSLQAMLNITSSSCINYRPYAFGDLDWIEIVTTGATGCTTKAQ